MSICWGGKSVKKLTHFKFQFQVGEADKKQGIGDDVIGKAVKAKHIMNVIECEDANENTPISEAASRWRFSLPLVYSTCSNYNTFF